MASAGDVVAESCRRQGIGSRLCQHSLQAARRLGFRAMQFNLVVSTNTAGIRAGSAMAFKWSAPCRGRSATSSWAMWMPW
ncbi:MAG: GNAT family N-acetyltransferase [Cyanobium sp. D14.bin.5]|nr:GNAT family N-acetyltransferase [Cyanobium sp. D14.bin.5]